eukprot:1698517-Rhodomonas_salina.7
MPLPCRRRYHASSRTSDGYALLLSDAIAMRCVVPAEALPLRIGYAMPGTELAYAGTRRVAAGHCSKVSPTIGLRACYALPGTDSACGAIGLATLHTMRGAEIASQVPHQLEVALPPQPSAAGSL